MPDRCQALLCVPRAELVKQERETEGDILQLSLLVLKNGVSAPVGHSLD